jgi:small-conductance mechanosensitive channel
MRGGRPVNGAEQCLTLAGVACILPAIAAAATGLRVLALFLSGTVAVTAAVLAVLYALQGNGPQAALYVGVAGYWAWLWWQQWRRRRRKRSLRALGHKARARLAAMARNMPRPGPVLRPAPQGAPA